MENIINKARSAVKKRKSYLLTFLMLAVAITATVIFVPGLFAKGEEVTMSTTKNVILKLLGNAEIPHSKNAGINTAKTKTGYVNFGGNEYWVVKATNGKLGFDFSGYDDAVTLYAKRGYLYYPFFRNRDSTKIRLGEDGISVTGLINTDYSSSDIRAYLSDIPAINAWLKDGNKGTENPNGGWVSGEYVKGTAGNGQSSDYYKAASLYDNRTATTFKNDFFTGRDVDWNSLNTTEVECGIIYDGGTNKRQIYKSYINEKFFLPDAHADSSADNEVGGSDFSGATLQLISVGPDTIRNYSWHNGNTTHLKGDAWYQPYVNKYTDKYFIQSNYWTLSSIPTKVSNHTRAYGSTIRTWSWGRDYWNVNQNLFYEKDTSRDKYVKTWWNTCDYAHLIAPACNLNLNKIAYVTLRTTNGQVETSSFTAADTVDTNGKILTLMLEDTDNATVKTKDVIVEEANCYDDKLNVTLSGALDTSDKIGFLVENDKASTFVSQNIVKKSDTQYQVSVADLGKITISKGDKFRVTAIAYQENAKGNYINSSNVPSDALTAYNYLIRYCKTLGKVQSIQSLSVTRLSALSEVYQEYEHSKDSEEKKQKTVDFQLSDEKFEYSTTLDWWCDDAQIKASFDKGFTVTLRTPSGYKKTLESGKVSEAFKLADGENIFYLDVKGSNTYQASTYTVKVISEPMASLSNLSVAAEGEKKDIGFNSSDNGYPEYYLELDSSVETAQLTAAFSGDGFTAQLEDINTGTKTPMTNDTAQEVNLKFGVNRFYIYTAATGKTNERYRLDIAVMPSAPGVSPESSTIYKKTECSMDVLLTEDRIMNAYYTRNGEIPEEGNSYIYTEPFNISSTQTIKARTFVQTLVEGEFITTKGSETTGITERNYTYEGVSQPEASQDSGTYYGDISVTLSCATNNAKIHYTTDGKTPTKDSNVYDKAIEIKKPTTIPSTIQLKAIAILYNSENEVVGESDVLTCDYAFKNFDIKAEKGSNTYNADITEKLSTDADDIATIKYTLGEGAEPADPSRTEGIEYTSGGIEIKKDEANTTKYLKVMAFNKNSANSDTTVQMFTYKFSTVKKVEGDLAGGTYYIDKTLKLTYPGDESGAVIYYTDDGETEPDTSSKKYDDNSGIALKRLQADKSTEIIIRAKAYVNGICGGEFKQIYTIKQYLQNPVAVDSETGSEMKSGDYYEDIKIKLTCEEERATIKYKIDGGSFIDYTKGSVISFSKVSNTAKKIYAEAYCDGVISVDEQQKQGITYTYNFKDVPLPEATLESGTYYGGKIDVDFKSADTYIYYTTDGTEPTVKSTQYIGQPIEIIKDTKLQAIAVSSKGGQSKIAVYEYKFAKLVSPTMSLESGTYHTAKSLTMSCSGMEYNKDYKIYYTLDKSDPRTSSSKHDYDGKSMALASGTTLIRAVAVSLKSGEGFSDIVTKEYIIKGAVAAPTVDKASGTYYESFKVTATNTDLDAKIQYALGSKDTWNDYTSPITIEKNGNNTVTLYLRAKADDGTIAEAQPYVYTFGDVAAPTSSLKQEYIYYSDQKTTLNSTTANAKIKWTANDTDPKVYGKEVTNNTEILLPMTDEPTKLRVVAYIGDTYSSETTYVYTFSLIGYVSCSLEEGTYHTSQTAKLIYNVVDEKNPEKYQVYYALDGEDPKGSKGTIYKDAIPLEKTKDDLVSRVIKSAAKITDSTGKEIWGETEEFNFDFVGMVKPEASLANGIYHDARTVTVTINSIGDYVNSYYTTDGTDPTSSSTPCDWETEITFEKNCGDKTLKIISIASENGQTAKSDIATYTYSFAALAKPTVSVDPSKGPFSSSVKVELKHELITKGEKGVSLYYTTNGDDPSGENGKLYSSAITISGVNETITLKAVAKHNDVFGEIGEYNYKFEKVAQPAASPGSGTYYASPSVELTSTTAGAKIYYTTDGTVPTDKSMPYSSAVSIPKENNKTVFLKAIAYSGTESSLVSAFEYAFADIAKPTANISAGDYYSDTLSIALNCETADSTIYYTVDGTNPTTDSKKYEDEFIINKPNPVATVTLKAKAFHSSGSESAALENAYVFKDITGVTATKGSGTYSADIIENLSCTTTVASIKYTLDGSDPIENPNSTAKIYSSGTGISIKKSTSNITLKAVAYINEKASSEPIYSKVSSFEYKFIQVLAPTSSLEAGTYYMDKETYLSTTPDDAVIRYTLNGTEPTESSTLYEKGKAIPIKKSSEKVVLKAKAWWNDGTTLYPSTVSTFTYDFVIIAKPTATPDGSQICYSNKSVTLACTTADAEIYYTIDGSTPTKNSSKYSEAITIERNTETPVVLKAIAFKNEGQSDMLTCTYTFAQLAAPKSNVQTGSYYAAQKVTLTSEAKDAVIRYTTDGTEPTAESSEYKAAVDIARSEKTVTLKAKAWLTEGTETYDSKVSTWEYTFLAIPQPTASVATGTYYTSQVVTLTSTADTAQTQIRYTVDGTEPTKDSTVYATPTKIEKNVEKPVTLKAAVFVGEENGKIESWTYTFENLPVPTATPSEGVYYKSLSVELKDTKDGAVIYYTKDGTDPTKLSTRYTSAISIEKVLGETVTIKAKAFYETLESEIVTLNYNFVDISSPTITPIGGQYTDAQKITIATTVSGGDIRYTLDGSEPTRVSAQYNGPITLEKSGKTTIIKAKVYYNDMESSTNVQTYSFTVDHWSQGTDGKWKYTENNKTVTGWKNNIPGWNGWFYFDTDGTMVTGWKSDIPDYIGKYFYFDANGLMITGWYNKIPGYNRWFYFDKTVGMMQVGWIKTTEGNDSLDGYWYYLTSDFSSTTPYVGWKFIDDYWYYLRPDWGGAMAVNEFIDGYYVDGEGHMQL